MEGIGALFFIGLKGKSLSSDEEKMIRQNKIGGVILCPENFENASQLAELVNSIQVLRDEYPLFIGTNHEGGKHTSFTKNFTQFPAMFELCRMNSPKIIYEVHSIMAKELKACGINLSFSPVCDIWTNPSNKVISERAFGIDAESVEKFTSAAIRGLQTHGILACAKHFPGHGNTLKDSHFDLPLIKDSLDSLLAREVQPFLKASKSRVEMMMMGHLLVDALDENYPTSLSPKGYEFLKSNTKFSKIIITDDMEMKAISNKYSLEEAGSRAILAGTDMLLYKSSESAQKVIDFVNESIKIKKISKEIIQEKIEKIEKTKKEYFSDYKPIYIPQIASSFNSSIGAQINLQYQSFLDGKKTPI